MDEILRRLVAGALAALALAGAPTAPAPRHGYVWPLSPQPAVVRGFAAPASPWAAGHRGVDLLGTTGQQVRAAGAGTVTFSGVIAGVGVVSITHANGWRTTYEPLDHRAEKGTTVQAGERIGALATAGSHCAPRACLHWGLLVAPDAYRDPLGLLRHRIPVLLPLA